ncbi:hypothetical protein BC936DRAFT_140318 [Jimgerdemannia flammicorona]|uniref:Uncharacterized protein n=1 Tax=Jimgerdemannia flammicorona TaxID=994334 RepID=A0A433DGW1_9FUNG|nr:hypothetical protein BC936DRAFT_140318 [Jimgerdemannia flammicorona]
MGPFLLTNLLLPVLERSAPARIVNVSSLLYRQDKLRFLLAISSLARIKHSPDIIVFSFPSTCLSHRPLAPIAHRPPHRNRNLSPLEALPKLAHPPFRAPYPPHRGDHACRVPGLHPDDGARPRGTMVRALGNAERHDLDALCRVCRARGRELCGRYRR